MSKRRKMSMIIFMIMMVGIFILSTKVEAALQANGGTPLTANLNNWISAVRQMQATGGTLGLTDTINTNLTSSNKNMDIHMQKNTEYGAMAILSTSAYGNPNKITDGQTTTGNASGIQIKLNKEWVAAGTSDTRAGNMKGASKRYWNIYTTNGNSEKTGDATIATAGWHGSGSSQWFYHNCNAHHNTSAPYAGMIRASSGSLFSYFAKDYNYDNGYSDTVCDYRVSAGYVQNPPIAGVGFFEAAAYGATYTSRACVVVGSGV